MGHPEYPECATYISCDQLELPGYQVPAEAPTAQLLLLDQLHSILQVKPWRRLEMFAVLNARYDARLPTVACATTIEPELRRELGDEWNDRLAIGDEITTIRDARNWRRT
jgi:hypothetical protein